MNETKSDVPEAVHGTARDPHKAGAIGQAAPREFDHLSVRQALCLFLEAYHRTRAVFNNG